MSLSSDFMAAREKSSHLLHDLGEAHPLVATLTILGGLVAALMMVTRLFMS